MNEVFHLVQREAARHWIIDDSGSDLRIKHVQIEGSVGVGLAARLVWRNYRLVAAIGGSAGAAPSLCDPSSYRPYSTGSCGCILCTAHRDSIANAVSVHWLLNQGFASGCWNWGRRLQF